MNMNKSAFKVDRIVNVLVLDSLFERFNHSAEAKRRQFAILGKQLHHLRFIVEITRDDVSEAGIEEIDNVLLVLKCHDFDVHVIKAFSRNQCRTALWLQKWNGGHIDPRLDGLDWLILSMTSQSYRHVSRSGALKKVRGICKARKLPLLAQIEKPQGFEYPDFGCLQMPDHYQEVKPVSVVDAEEIKFKRCFFCGVNAGLYGPAMWMYDDHLDGFGHDCIASHTQAIGVIR
jgi:hypothetical protein